MANLTVQQDGNYQKRWEHTNTRSALDTDSDEPDQRSTKHGVQRTPTRSAMGALEASGISTGAEDLT